MDNKEDFFKNYRGRYSSYWIERWGLIPELPTSFDNANSIYELLAWLQRAFKNLLDDFQQLESEFEDFKNAIIDLLEYLIPELIRRYHNSMEFRITKDSGKVFQITAPLYERKKTNYDTLKKILPEYPSKIKNDSLTYIIQFFYKPYFLLTYYLL